MVLINHTSHFGPPAASDELNISQWVRNLGLVNPLTLNASAGLQMGWCYYINTVLGNRRRFRAHRRNCGQFDPEGIPQFSSAPAD